jgi:hypothetical protein
MSSVGKAITDIQKPNIRSRAIIMHLNEAGQNDGREHNEQRPSPNVEADQGCPSSKSSAVGSALSRIWSASKPAF